MRRIFAASFLAISLALGFSNTMAETETTIEKMTLKSGETKEFSINATSPMMIGFKHNMTSKQARKCMHNCIKMSHGGNSVAYMMGGSMQMQPKDGKIEGSLKNVETFPIEVELIKEKGK
jgi:hypothetical protein